MRRAREGGKRGRGVGLCSGVGAGEEEGVDRGVMDEAEGKRARSALCFSSRVMLLL